METFCAENIKQWDKWLKKNHLKKDKITLIKYKKHTGKNINNLDAMKVAISYGWIDTTIKRIDEDRYSQNFSKRNKNSKWSLNTLSYGKELLEKGLMSDFGKKMYLEGLQKKPHDADIPKNPEMPEELKFLLKKNKELKQKFEALAPSLKKMYYRMILRGKRKETKEKTCRKIISELKTRV